MRLAGSLARQRARCDSRGTVGDPYAPTSRCGKVRPPMRTTAFALMCAFVACVAANSAHASNRIQYGIQDDAWLEFGPGTLEQRVATFDRLGVPLVRFTLHWNQIAMRRPKQPTAPQDRAY